jgi:hypothetical protein
MGERLGIACSYSGGAEPPVELRLAIDQAGASRPEAIEVEGECDSVAWTAALGVTVAPVGPDRTRAAPVALELLQYEFAPRMADWRAWRVPAVLAAALALAWIAALNIDAWLKLREERQLRAQMTTVFREAFPRVPVVLDPLAQMRRALVDMRSGAGTSDTGDFLPLAARFAQAVQVEAEAVRLIRPRPGAVGEFEPAQWIGGGRMRRRPPREGRVGPGFPIRLSCAGGAERIAAARVVGRARTARAADDGGGRIVRSARHHLCGRS